MAEFLEGRVREFSIEDLRGTRCRLQRLTDLKFFSGWIRSVASKQVEVELKDSIAVEVGNRFNLEAAVDMANVGLPCILTRAAGASLQLSVVGEPVFSTPGQEARYRAEGISVSISGSDLSVLAQAVDVSASGIGVLVRDQIPRFARVRLMVQAQSTYFECAGLVRYCRPDAESQSMYRVGFQVEFDDRLSRAMWLRLVQSTASSVAKAA
ncbi:MAG: PilZ domain-containing protein [Chlorobia bacterium]|nr:PilZ domain-containing protein [Fimbriimonadaceae bacterium]